MGILDYCLKLLDKERVMVFDKRIPSHPRIISLLRIRNESLIIKDTLDHLASFSDGIICYDDASTDNTFSIISSHESVIGIVRNYNWSPEPSRRIVLETQHRKSIMEFGKKFNPEWFFCADADERYVGDIRGFIDSERSKEIDIVKIKLFDAYITENDKLPIDNQQNLMNFRKYFGPERRDIIMMWRATNNNIVFEGTDSREPRYSHNEKISTEFYCQHYGKSLSIQHWEETCDYYINHFPFDSYGQKWLLRKGKAIHKESDFGRPLYRWGEELFNNAYLIN
ncbi:glycosyltransferase family 2 protein [Paenibacillus harenae]|uniref:glycosyltransferase family 2 protein n=1 Tax=Paenibacillus harenae TaxID=306543 RepID=UPI0004034A2E|nr:glycosyltransferase family 2 protein [Paenibacillus harenae]